MIENAGQVSVTIMVIIFAIILWSLELTPSHAIKTYALEEECGQELSLILDSVYQGKLVFRPQTSTPRICEVTMETWYSMPHLMFYFVSLNLSCSDGYAEVKDGRDTPQPVTGLDRRICGTRESELPPDVYLTSSQYLRIKYTRVRQVEQTDVLSIVFTAYSTESCRNDQYECSNDRCIHDELRCNGHNPCGDQSDCKHTISSVTTAGIVAASLVGLCILATIITMVTYHLYCKKKLKNRRSNAHMLYNNNHNGCVGHHDDTVTWHQAGTMSIVSGQQPAYPRNWSYSGHQGYNYNNMSRPMVTMNTNFHCWFAEDRRQTGSNDSRIGSSDLDTIRPNATNEPFTAHLPNMYRVDGGIEIDGTNRKQSLDDEDEVYIEDEVMMDDKINESVDKNKNSDTQIQDLKLKDKNGGHDIRVSQSKNKLECAITNEDLTKHDKAVNDIVKDSVIDSGTVTPKLDNDKDCDRLTLNDARVADRNSDVEEIDKSFEDFYRDLLPDDYYDGDVLNLDNSKITDEYEEKVPNNEKEIQQLTSGGSDEISGHDNSVFSTDL